MSRSPPFFRFYHTTKKAQKCFSNSLWPRVFHRNKNSICRRSPPSYIIEIINHFPTSSYKLWTEKTASILEGILARTTPAFIAAFASHEIVTNPNITSCCCRMVRTTETYIASITSSPCVGVWVVPQETIEAASAAASIAEKIALSAFVEFISCAVYRQVLDGDELEASGVCFAGQDHQILRLYRSAASAEKSYHNALLHLSSLVEVPDDDDDELLLAPEGTIER